MSPHDDTYSDLLVEILENGDQRTDRTGVGTKAIFGAKMRFDLSQGFPLLTTKRVFWRGIVEELLWFLRGETNVRSLQEKGVHIWDEWADEDGNLGPVYGAQWRNWRGVSSNGRSFTVDQIGELIKGLIKNPDSRRHIVTAWNPLDLDDMKLPPCHCLFQFDVTSDGRLSCLLYQRSADVFLGVPFNIASYALLTHMVAHVVGMKVGEFISVGGNTHIYLNHMDQVNEQLEREPREAPTLKLNYAVNDILAFTAADIELQDYNPHPAIAAEVAV